jgi:thiamine-phosphate pyrophosphorylase
MKGYYFITDAGLSRAGNQNDVMEAVAAGAQVIQYRAKDLHARDMFTEAKQLRSLCRDARFIVNDRVDIALAVKADGVHLGQEDLPLAVARELLGPSAIIGVTVHNLAEAQAAAEGGADYLGVSPVFMTQTKRDAGAPAGLRLIAEIKATVSLPLVAIGGINLQNTPEVIRAGADSVCAISAVVTQPSVHAAIRAFQKHFGLF